MADSAQILAGDLIQIHKVITRGLEVAEIHFDSNLGSQEGSIGHPAGYSMFLTCLLTFMLSHHEGEDEIGFPYLKKKVEGLNLEKLIEDHKAMHPLIVEAQGLLKETRSGKTAARLREILVDLRQMWLNHIGDEEECFGCELISRCLSVEGAESLGDQFSAHGRAESKPASRMLPFVYYSLEGADREYIGKAVPGFVRNILVPILWKPSWKPMQQFLLPA